MATQVALLRGVNVGGKNRVSMAALVALFEAAGCRAVRTYIQSGNVVFDADDVPVAVEALLADHLGGPVPVVWRLAAEVVALRQAGPFAGGGVPASEAHVAFLRELPDPSRVAALAPDRSPGDRFVVVGREVHLHLPGGVGRSKLTNDWLDRSLGTVSTLRNWNTVEALATLVAG